MTTASMPLSEGQTDASGTERASGTHDGRSRVRAWKGRLVQGHRPITVRTVVAARTRAGWIALACLLVFSFAVYFINLTANGSANEFYSAAAQAGSTNWWSFLWGSSDAGNSITVDKPPAALWLMSLSVRLFDLSSFSILLPEALCGVGTVWLLYASVRRYWGNSAGIIAGFVLATTPVAALMFRYNNPDALLVLLMTAASYAVLRSLEYPADRLSNRRRTAWMALAGCLIGLGFLTKQLQVLLVVPGFIIAFLLASPTSWPRRLGDGLLAIGTMAVSAGWWVLLTVLVPASKRPYIGGSQNNSFLELTFGYNGFGRLTGNETGAVIGGGARAGATNRGGNWGSTGISRLFDGVFGGQIAWLAFIAFAGIVIGLLVARGSARTDLRRASVLVFGSWLLVTWLIFSFMGGIFHQYYTVALAPAVAVLVAIACAGLWQRRSTFWARAAATLLTLITACWSFELLGRSDWLPWLRYAVLAAGLMATLLLGIAALQAFPARSLRRMRTDGSNRVISRIGVAGIVLSAIACLAGPVAWTGYTVATGHHGSIVTAGPNVASAAGFGGGPGAGAPGAGGTSAGAAPGSGPGGSGSALGMGLPGGQQGGMNGGSSQGQTNQQPSGQSGQSGQPSQRPNGQSQPGAQSQPGMPSNGASAPSSQGKSGMLGKQGQQQGQRGKGQQKGRLGQNGQPGQPGKKGGGMGSLLGGQTASSKVINLLKKNSSKYTWVAATTGSQNAATYQLVAQKSVMPIGGFNGSDPSPTLATFKRWVKAGKIHYYIASSQPGKGGPGGGASAASGKSASSAKGRPGTGMTGSMGGTQLGGSNAAQQIATWVASHFHETTVDGVVLYDLANPIGK